MSFFFAEGQGGIPKSAREQKGNKTFSGVHSRRLGGWANLESEKHASKLGAFANAWHEHLEERASASDEKCESVNAVLC